MDNYYRIYSLKLFPERGAGEEGAYRKMGALFDVADQIMSRQVKVGSGATSIRTDHDHAFAPSVLRIEMNTLEDIHLVHTYALPLLKKASKGPLILKRHYAKHCFNQYGF